MLFNFRLINFAVFSLHIQESLHDQMPAHFLDSAESDAAQVEGVRQRFLDRFPGR